MSGYISFVEQFNICLRQRNAMFVADLTPRHCVLFDKPCSSRVCQPTRERGEYAIKPCTEDIDECIRNQCVEKIFRPCIRCGKPVLIAESERDDDEELFHYGVDCPGCLELWLPCKNVKEFILFWNSLSRE